MTDMAMCTHGRRRWARHEWACAECGEPLGRTDTPQPPYRVFVGDGTAEDSLFDLVAQADDGDPMSYELREYADDVERIVRVLGAHRLHVEPRDAALAWKLYSEAMFASWLILPPDDDDVLLGALVFLRSKHHV